MLKISYKICFVLIILILAIAFINFVCVSCGVQRIVNQTNQTVCHIDTLCMQNNDLVEEDDKRMNVDVGEIKKSIREIDILKRGVFDSNTITFLTSFVLVFLGGILFDIEKRAKNILVKSKEATEGLEIKQTQLDIYKLTSTMSILKSVLHFQFSANNYIINQNIFVIIHEIHNTLRELQSLLMDHKKIRYITEEARIENMSRFNDVKLFLEKEEIYNQPENLGKLTPLIKVKKLVDECIVAMDNIELYKAIDV